MWHVWRLICALQRVLVVFIASDALMLTQEPCQWLWSWILLETMMGLYAHKVCAVVDTRCCCAIVSIWATPYLQMLESNMPRDARASSLPHAMLKKVALAGPKSLHIITRVASSLAGQLRMMAGPILCSKWRRARNQCNSRFLGSVVSQWHEIIEVFHCSVLWLPIVIPCFSDRLEERSAVSCEDFERVGQR